MAVYLLGGKVLLDGGKVAVHEDCCCQDCSIISARPGWPNGEDLFPRTFLLEIAGAAASAPPQGCAACTTINGNFGVTYYAGRWHYPFPIPICCQQYLGFMWYWFNGITFNAGLWPPPIYIWRGSSAAGCVASDPPNYHIPPLAGEGYTFKIADVAALAEISVCDWADVLYTIQSGPTSDFACNLAGATIRLTSNHD